MELRTDRFKLKAELPDLAKKYARKLHKKAGEIEFVRKGIPIDPENIEIKDGERAAIRLVTTPHLDRDGEILIPSGAILDDFRQSPSVLFGHDYKSLPIGSDQWIKLTRQGILAKTVYAKHQFAEDVYQCVKDKHLVSNSVGFIPVEAVTPEDDKKAFADWQGVLEKDYGIDKEESGKAKAIYTKWIMLEHSDVPVASNAQSVNLAVSKGELVIKSKRLRKELEIEVVKDAEIEIVKDKEVEVIKVKNDKKEKEREEETKDEAVAEEEKGFTETEIKEPEYKERWNKSLSKVFDVASVQVPVASFNYALYEKFLNCKVKNIFINNYSIPSPLLGTYLAGFKEVLGKFKLKDTRSFTWDGREMPLRSEVIKLNSEKSDDFIVNGVCFYDAGGKPLAIKYAAGWTGLDVSMITSVNNKEWNKDLLDKVHDWVHENNYLKGEKFALNGEFLDEPGDDWDNLILDPKYKDPIIKSANFLEKKGADLTGRGLLFIGPPGTGKTKTGRVLMNELDTTFIWVSSRDFRHTSPLTALSLGFSLARDLAPSILFLEDIDTWLGGYVTDLVKTEMDGIKQNKGLITIMTSNYPEKLPDALLDRPGRFHHIINFELPKGAERKKMIAEWAGDIEEKLLDNIVEKTEGFSGAHLKELVEFAKMIAEEDESGMGKALLKSLDKLIGQRELIDEIRGNQTEVKAFWGRVKWAGGAIEVKKDRDIEVSAKGKQEKFNCECIKCGHKLASEKHCNEIKCPKCGGEMRRQERPGPGKDADQEECDHEWGGVTCITSYKGEYKKEYKCSKCGATKSISIDESSADGLSATVRITDMDEFKTVIGDLKSEIVELKEGRVLSTKNRTLVKDAIDALVKLKDGLDELYTATEPVVRNEEERTATIEMEKQAVIERDGNAVALDDQVSKKIDEALSGENLVAVMKDSVSKAIDVALKKKMGKVE